MKSFFSMSRNSKITSIAMGKFDGVHLAHQKLFEYLNSDGCVLVIDKKSKECITPLEIRSKLIGHLCYLVSLEEVHSWSGGAFIEFLCQKLPNLKRIVVGYDFCFGKDKNYGADDLKNLFDGEVIIVPEVKIENIPLHSSIIKELICFGDIALANKLLGRYYQIDGEVVSGQKIGSKELYPTINVKTNSFVIPGNGVYVALSDVGSKTFPSVCFVGNRLSTDRSFAIESHILDKFIELEQKRISIEFIQKIRDNRHFDSLAELKKQISLDIEGAKKILNIKD